MGIKRNSRMCHIRIQNNSGNTFNIGNIHVHQDKESHYSFYQFAYGSKIGRLNLFTNLNGKGAECFLNGLALTCDHQHLDVQKSLSDLNDLFIIFDDPKDKFVQLMDMAKESEKLTEIEKTDNNKIYGCTSQAWVVAEDNGDETYRIKTDSDALIVKGLLSILEKIFSGQPVNEILSINSMDILKSVGLDGIITSQRTNGFSNAVEKIQGLVK